MTHVLSVYRTDAQALTCKFFASLIAVESTGLIYDKWPDQDVPDRLRTYMSYLIEPSTPASLWICSILKALRMAVADPTVAELGRYSVENTFVVEDLIPITSVAGEPDSYAASDWRGKMMLNSRRGVR